MPKRWVGVVGRGVLFPPQPSIFTFWASSIPLDDGNAVATWEDIGPNGYDMTEATSTRRPIFRSSVSALNNRPGVEFDSVNDRIAHGLFGVTYSQPVTYVAVAALTGSGTENNLFAAGGHALDFRDTFAQMTVVGGTDLTGAHVLDGSVHIYVCRFDGASSSFDIDGVEVDTGDASATTATRIGVGQNLDPCEGHLAFLAAYESATDPSGVVSYLTSYYGI